MLFGKCQHIYSRYFELFTDSESVDFSLSNDVEYVEIKKELVLYYQVLCASVIPDRLFYSNMPISHCSVFFPVMSVS